MKRFFTVTGFSALLSLLLLNHILTDYALILSLTALGLFVLSMFVPFFRRQKELPVSLFSVFLISLLFFCVNKFVYLPATEYASDEYVEIEAQLTDFPTISSGGNYSYSITTDKIGDEDVKVKMRLYVPYEIAAQPYDVIRFSSRPFVIGTNENQYLYFKSRGMKLGVFSYYISEIIETDKKPLNYYFVKFKGDSEKLLADFFEGDNKAFCESILFSDKRGMSEDLYSLLKSAGLSHIMAVSGMHMSIWVLGLYLLLRKLGQGYKRAAVSSIVFCLLIMGVTGFSVSVVRAGIMVIIYLSSHLAGRRADALNSIGLAMTVLCFSNPFIVGDMSFLLSFFATLGIVILGELLPEKVILNEKPYHKVLKYLGGVVLCSFAASLFTYPLTVKYFSTVSVYSIFSNLLAVPAITPCLLLSGVLILLPSVKFITYPVKYAVLFLQKYLFCTAGVIAKIPFAVIETENIIITVVVPLLIGVGLFLIYNLKNKEFSFSSLLLLLSFAVICLTN